MGKGAIFWSTSKRQRESITVYVLMHIVPRTKKITGQVDKWNWEVNFDDKGNWAILLFCRWLAPNWTWGFCIQKAEQKWFCSEDFLRQRSGLKWRSSFTRETEAYMTPFRAHRTFILYSLSFYWRPARPRPPVTWITNKRSPPGGVGEGRWTHVVREMALIKSLPPRLKKRKKREKEKGTFLPLYRV